MNERLRFIISGFFVGLAELLPGISGSTVAIAFNVYEKFILFLSNLRISNLSLDINKLNKVFFLDLIIPFFLSMIISILFFSKLVLFLFTEYTSPFSAFLGILMCFISLLIIKRLKDEFADAIKWKLFFLLGIIFGILLNQISFVAMNPSLYLIAFIGFIAFSFFLMPGISGSAILLSIGVYELIIRSIAEINFLILIPFAIGCIASLLIMPKFINLLIIRYKMNVMVFFSALILASGALLFPAIKL